MEVLVGFVLVLAVLAFLDFAALRWGVNSRPGTSDWQPHTEDYKLPGFRF